MRSCFHPDRPEPTGDSEPSALKKGAQILVIDDDEDMRSLLSDVLGDEGYGVSEARNGAEALLRLHRDTFAAILLDKNMPGLSGMDLLPGLRLICPDTPVIMITAFGDAHTAAEGSAKGARGCLFKPFRIDELLMMLQRALAPPVAPGDVSTVHAERGLLANQWRGEHGGHHEDSELEAGGDPGP